MDPAVFNAAQPLLDKLAEVAEKQLASAELQQLLREFASIVGKKKFASLTITVDVCDEDRQCALPLLTTGLSAVVGKEPFRTWGDSTPQRYVVEEGIQVVPHDRCPKCWEKWISNCRIHRARTAGSRWGKHVSCCWIPMNAPGARREK